MSLLVARRPNASRSTTARRLGLLGVVALFALIAGPQAEGSSRRVDYRPLAPFELALMADLIVDGTVIEFETPVHEGDVYVYGAETGALFTIRVNEVVIGELKEESLEVLQFTNWTCARRYAPYEKGQRALFHLARARGKKGRFVDLPPRVLGGGNDGECPIIGDSILHQANGWDDCVQEDHPAFGHKFRGVFSARADYIAAIRGLRDCYRWDRDPKDQSRFMPDGFNQLFPDEKVAAIEASSDVAARFVHEAREYQARAMKWLSDRRERRERRGK